MKEMGAEVVKAVVDVEQVNNIFGKKIEVLRNIHHR